MRHPQTRFFQQTLALLGPTAEAQASAVGLSRRTIGRYGERLPRSLRLLLEHPILLAALLLDALLWKYYRELLPEDDSV